MGITALILSTLRHRAVNKFFIMFRKIVIFSLFSVAIFSVAFFSLSPRALAADDLNGLNTTAGKVSAFASQVSSTDDNFIQTKAGQIIGTILSFVGVLFLILMIYAGVMWMTAQGNDQQVTKAKDLLINSIIGLIIIFAAYALTNFIGGFVSNQFNP